MEGVSILGWEPVQFKETRAGACLACSRKCKGNKRGLLIDIWYREPVRRRISLVGNSGSMDRLVS